MRMILAALLAAPLLLPLDAAAQNRGPNVETATEGQERDGPVARLHLAGELHAMAIRARDPVLALAAARLTQAVSLRQTERPGSQTAGREADKPPADGPQGAEAMLATARALAGGSAPLRALIEQAAQPQASRGRMSGPLTGTIVMQPQAQWRSDPQQGLVFRAGERAEVAIQGDGDTDVDLFVLDEMGTEICRRVGPTDREFCAWTPRWTGEFTITLRNLGDRPNRVRLISN